MTDSEMFVHFLKGNLHGWTKLNGLTIPAKYNGCIYRLNGVHIAQANFIHVLSMFQTMRLMSKHCDHQSLNVSKTWLNVKNNHFGFYTTRTLPLQSIIFRIWYLSVVMNQKFTETGLFWWVYGPIIDQIDTPNWC